MKLRGGMVRTNGVGARQQCQCARDVGELVTDLRRREQKLRSVRRHRPCLLNQGPRRCRITGGPARAGQRTDRRRIIRCQTHDAREYCRRLPRCTGLEERRAQAHSYRCVANRRLALRRHERGAGPGVVAGQSLRVGQRQRNARVVRHQPIRLGKCADGIRELRRFDRRLSPLQPRQQRVGHAECTGRAVVM